MYGAHLPWYTAYCARDNASDHSVTKASVRLWRHAN